MMAKEYKKRGGDYNTPKESKDESQRNLEKWGDEEWQTKEGSGKAKKDDGNRKRYLPKKAWDGMSEEEKEETDRKKQEEGKDKQFVENTSKAKDARRRASRKDEEAQEDDAGDEVQSSGNDKPSSDNGKDEVHSDVSHTPSEKENQASSQGRKRGRKQNDESERDQKKQRSNGSKGEGKAKGKASGTIGSKHDKADAPAQQGSTERLPKKGQKGVHWKAMPGWVEGEVIEIVTSSKSVEGKQVKGSKDDPKVVLKSKSSGKICVHKADNVYFD